MNLEFQDETTQQFFRCRVHDLLHVRELSQRMWENHEYYSAYSSIPHQSIELSHQSPFQIHILCLLISSHALKRHAAIPKKSLS